jgi:hypothetical protein
MASVNIVEAKEIHIKRRAKNYVVHSTLKKIEDKLPKDLFLKCIALLLSILKKLLILKTIVS